MKYDNHSKFVFSNYDSIQDAINSGLLNANDIVISEDTCEIIIIKNDLSLFPIKSKVYRYLDTESAETELNKKADTYEGQLVSVLSQRGTYEAYIVNKNIRGKFYISPLNAYSGNIDYNTLQHKPIENLNGEVGKPIIIATQNNGIYRVNGNYKIYDHSETVYSSQNNNLFIVEHVDDNIKVKKIGSNEIIDYIINQYGDITTSVVPTTEWLKSQGYVTEPHIDKKLEALGIITQKNLEDYVQNVVLQTIDATIDQRIDVKLGELFEETTEREIVNMFI